MKKDIENRDDIHSFVSQFYHNLLDDKLLMHFFEDIVQKNELEQHLETITNFWNDILFNTFDYQQNAMKPHLVLNKTKPFKEVHFKTWLYYFNSVMDKNFKGEIAERAKTRALSIATVMKIKMLDS